MPKSDKIIYLVLFISLFGSVCIAQTAVIQNDQVAVIYGPPLQSAAREIVEIYPAVKQDLQDIFGWSLNFKPQVVLVKSNQEFQGVTGNPLFVAVAVPERQLVIIDYSKMNVHPFTLATTLKHELCHLLLHDYLGNQKLPRWLDEGICQWASDGIAEILLDDGRSVLNTAVLSGRQLPLARLRDRFPQDRMSLILAYAQSKSIVDYITREYGRKAVLDILRRLQNGDSAEEALDRVLSMSIEALEDDWLGHLKRAPTVLAFIADHIYSVLFFLAAILTILGFVRLVIRRRKYSEEEEN